MTGRETVEKKDNTSRSVEDPLFAPRVAEKFEAYKDILDDSALKYWIRLDFEQRAVALQESIVFQDSYSIEKTGDPLITMVDRFVLKGAIQQIQRMNLPPVLRDSDLLISAILIEMCGPRCSSFVDMKGLTFVYGKKRLLVIKNQMHSSDDVACVDINKLIQNSWQLYTMKHVEQQTMGLITMMCVIVAFIMCIGTLAFFKN
jgi:hypothetical protein